MGEAGAAERVGENGTTAERVVAALRRGEVTVAVAESLTGGLVCARLVDVPGASAVVRGAVVAYAAELKHRLLGVDAALLDRSGTVHPEVARQMAAGVRERLGADYGLATTGVAGPDPNEGHPPGTVYVAACGPLGARVSRLSLPGDRSAVRAGAVEAALRLLLDRVQAAEHPGPEPALPGPPPR